MQKYLKDIYAKSKVKFILYAITLLGLLSLIIVLLISGKSALDNILFSDRADYFMDYFNSIFYGLNGPYVNYNVIYPPLITVGYQAIGLLLENYYGTFMNGFEIRNTFAGMASYIIFTIIAMAILYLIFSKDRKVSKKEMLLFFIIIITSYPMVYCLDRGNSMLYSVAFIMLFLFFYKSPNKKYRYLSYISLGIATSIKIYPVIFGILILKESIEDKNYKELIASAVICIVMFFLPFLLTDGTFIDMFRNATHLSEVGVSFGQVNITALMETFLTVAGIENYADYRNLGTVLSLILLGVILIFVLFDKKMPVWQTVCLLACSQVLCSGLGTQYLLLYMIIPAWYFINSNPKDSKIHIIYGVLFALILFMVPGVGPSGNILTFLKGMITLTITIIILTTGFNRIRDKSENPQNNTDVTE